MSIYDKPEPYREERTETYEIVISVFMDGTQNNPYNTKARQEHLKKQEFDKTPAFGAGKGQGYRAMARKNHRTGDHFTIFVQGIQGKSISKT